MRSLIRAGLAVGMMVLGLHFPANCAGASFRVASYNLENYLDAAVGTRVAKSDEARSKIQESILAIKPDVLAVQEVGGTNALLELRASLKTAGLELPHWEHVTGSDTNIHVAVLSRFPFATRIPHTRESFLLSGRRFQVSRGFAEVEVQVNASYRFTLITAHLKSRRLVPEADEAELREQEALKLREIIDTRLKANPELNLIVLGDFNDVKDSKSTRVLIGRGRNSLVDTRPAERNGDNHPNPNPRYEPRNITWTHYYGKEDSYSRIDYIFISHGMAKEWLPKETYVLSLPNWGVASDHRPITASFIDKEQ